jgi:hypothetical protein
MYESLEAERASYTIRLRANGVLQDRLGYPQKRGVGRLAARSARSFASFSSEVQSWNSEGVLWPRSSGSPGELYPRVGFIVTNLARPALEQFIKEGKGPVKSNGRGCHIGPLLPMPSVSSFMCAGIQLGQLHAAAGDAQAGGAVVVDQPARKAGQDRREGRQPRALRHVPGGRGRDVATDVPRNLTLIARLQTSSAPARSAEGG